MSHFALNLVWIQIMLRMQLRIEYKYYLQLIIAIIPREFFFCWRPVPFFIFSLFFVWILQIVSLLFRTLAIILVWLLICVSICAWLKKNQKKENQETNKTISKFHTGINNHRHKGEKYDGLAEKKSANSITPGLFYS